MEQLNHEQQMALARLCDDRGYQILIKYLKQYEEILREDLVRKQDPKDALRHLRFWQFYTQFLNLLADTPQSALADLERLRLTTPEEEVLDYQDPVWKFHTRKIDSEEETQ